MNVINPSHDSQVSTDPLFSCIATLYTLILLYFPYTLRNSLSLVLLLTSLLLLLLLRLGSSHKPQLQPPLQKQEENKKVGGDIDVKCQTFTTNTTTTTATSITTTTTQEMDQRVAKSCEPGSGIGSSFVGWDVGAPLEVIYEDYHEGGESDGEGDHDHLAQPVSGSSLVRYPSLSMCYPETDSDSSLDDGDCSVAEEWGSPESLSFWWEEEDKDGSLIEIALNRGGKKEPNPVPGIGLDFCVEEDNLIEIDILSRLENDDVGFCSEKFLGKGNNGCD